MENLQNEYDYTYFKRAVKELLGMDLDLYKEAQMKRRTETLIKRRKCNGYKDYVEKITTDPEELEILKNYITINVTEFFRDEKYWDYFIREVIPELKNRGGKLRLWSIACASGEEVYSLAICMCERAPEVEFEIIGTDIDEKMLGKAKDGFYRSAELEKVPQSIRDRYFEKAEEGYEVTESLKDKVNFVKMDILVDEYPKNCDVILCRNVLIYFTNEAKNVIFEKMGSSLKKGGYVFFGRTEQIVNWRQSPFKKLASSFYQLRE